MADGRHIENRFLEEAELRSDTGHVTIITKFENSRRWMTAILKMVSSLYLSCGSSDFNEIWCIIWFQERSHIKVSKFCKFNMADGRFVCERLYVGLHNLVGALELIGDVLLF